MENDERSLLQSKGYMTKRQTPSFSPLAPAPVIQQKRAQENDNNTSSQMSILESPVTGFVEVVNIVTYDTVKAGDILFIIRDKHNQQQQIFAPEAGIIGPIVAAKGSEIQSGDFLCSLHKRVRF